MEQGAEGDDPPVCWICRIGEEESREDIDAGTDAGMADHYAGEPLVQGRCCCRGPLGVVHQSCINRWVLAAGHRTCGLCGATYTLVAAGVEAPILDGATGGWQRALHDWSGPWLLYLAYTRRVLGALLGCAWHCFLRFGVLSALLRVGYHLPPPVHMLLGLRYLKRTLAVVAAAAVLWEWWWRGGVVGWATAPGSLHESPLFLASLCGPGWLAQLVGWYLRRSWYRFRYPHAVRQRETERRRWREEVNQLPWAGRWLETARRWQRHWSSPQRWPQWETQFDVLVASVAGYAGAFLGMAAATCLFCLPEYHQPPCPPLLFDVNMEVVGVDTFDEEAAHRPIRAARQPPQPPQPPPFLPHLPPQQEQPRPLNQARRRRFGRQHRIRQGVYRTCVVVRGPVYAFLQRELVRWVHLGLAPLLTGMAAHVATSPVLSWRLDLGNVWAWTGGRGRGYGIAPSLFPTLAHVVVFGAVPPSPFEALVCFGVMLRDVVLGRCSLGDAGLRTATSIYHAVTFPLGWLDMAGYWMAGVVVLWAATILVVRPLMQVTMSARLVTDRLGFCVTHPLDVAAVDRLVAFGWVRGNQRREWMGGSSVLAWAVDTTTQVLPREVWRALCRCLTCLLLLLVGTSLVVSARLVGERTGLLCSFTRGAPGTGVTMMEAEPLPIWRLPPVAEEVQSSLGAQQQDPPPPPPPPTGPATAKPLRSISSGSGYTDAFAFVADAAAETWRLVPAVRSASRAAMMGLAGRSDRAGDCRDTAREDETAAAARSSSSCHHRRGGVPWLEWGLTGALLLLCALFMEIYPWHYYWLRRMMPLYRWWGHSILRLPATGPRSVFCDGQQSRQLVRWLRACQRRVAVATPPIVAPGPPLYEAVGAALGWDPIHGGGGGGVGVAGSPSSGYPHRLRLRQELNRNDNEPSLARYAQSVRVRQREARRRVRAEERAEAAARRRRRDQQRRRRGLSSGTGGEARPRNADEAAAPRQHEEEEETPQQAARRPRQPFAALPVRYHRTFSDWLHGEVRCRYPSRTPPPLHQQQHQQHRQEGTRQGTLVVPHLRTLLRVRRRVGVALVVGWYEVRVALFVAGALVGTAAYLGCVLACVFAILMDVVPSCLLLVGLCGALGAALASPWTFVVAATSFVLTPCMVVVLFALEARSAARWVWRLLTGAPEQVQAVALALHPTRLDVGPYQRPSTSTTEPATTTTTTGNAPH